jgi:hypothetical protein
MSTFNFAGEEAGPWNKGRLIGQKLPLKLKEIWAIRIRLQLARRIRNLALFNLAIDSKLRDVIWSSCMLETLLWPIVSCLEQRLCSKRPIARFSSKLPSKRERP